MTISFRRVRVKNRTRKWTRYTPGDWCGAILFPVKATMSASGPSSIITVAGTASTWTSFDEAGTAVGEAGHVVLGCAFGVVRPERTEEVQFALDMDCKVEAITEHRKPSTSTCQFVPILLLRLIAFLLH